jgi:polar amino acid transport system permease protein
MQDLGIRVLFMGNNFARLLAGLWVTVKISIIAIVCSIFLGILLGAVMTSKNPIVKGITKVYLEFIRIMPQLVLLFLVYFGLSRSFGWNLSGEVSAVMVFTLWGTAEMGDLVRGALISIPKHQYESGEALGLTKIQIYRWIIIPQTLRRLIPLAINLMTRMIKTTSLIVLIGVVEVLKAGQQIIEANRYTVPDAALWIYGTIFFLYFFTCWPISVLAARLERKWEN